MTLEGIAINLRPIKDAVDSKSYDNLADICDDLMLRVASEGVAFQEDWPYSIHLLGHIYANDVNSARFLWKTIPLSVKEKHPEVLAAWTISQKLWIRDYGAVYEAIRSFNWSPEAQGIISSFAELYRRRMFELLVAAYSTINVQEAAVLLGANEDEATKYVLQEGWSLDAESRMLTVKKQPVVSEQKLDQSKLQRLTEYVFHLEH